MIERGCGYRQNNSLYCVVESSPCGMPISYFIIDPPLFWRGACPLRSPMFVKDKTGIYHIVLGIGKKYYPFVSDYITEASIFGISKKFPRNFDPSPLTPGKSKLILMHPRGIPNFHFRLKRYECPKGIKKVHDCIGSLWDLSSVKSFKKVHEVTDLDGRAKVTTPSVSYVVDYPLECVEWKSQVYLPALILQFSRFKFQYVNKNGFVPKEVEKKITETGFELEVVSE